MNGQEGVARGDAAQPARLPKLWRRRRTKLIALGAGLFVCGGFFGSCVTAGAMHRRVVKSLRNPDEVPVRMVSHMRRDLDLTDEQAEKVLAILRSKHEALAGVFRATFDSAHTQVRAVLTDEQAARWDKRAAKIRAHIFGAAADDVGDAQNR